MPFGLWGGEWGRLRDGCICEECILFTSGGEIAQIESYLIDCITPSSKHHKRLRRRLSLSAAHTDNAHIATAATSCMASAAEAASGERLPLVRKAYAQLWITIRAMSREKRGASKCSLAIASSLTLLLLLQPFYGSLDFVRDYWGAWAGTRRNIHSLTPTVVISHPLSTSNTIHGILSVQLKVSQKTVGHVYWTQRMPWIVLDGGSRQGMVAVYNIQKSSKNKLN